MSSERQIRISAQGSFLIPDPVEIWEARDLFWLLIRREWALQYRQTLFGSFWHLFHPIFGALIFTAVFGYGLGISTEKIPPALFYLSGLTLWGYFTSTLTAVAQSLLRSADLIKKAYFPRFILPISALFFNLPQFFFQAIVVAGMAVCLRGMHRLPEASFGPAAGFALLGWILITSGLALGAGLWLAALAVRRRDIQQLQVYGLQAWMYATPVFYPLSIVSAKWQVFLKWNPMTPIIENFRTLVFGFSGRPMIGLAVPVLAAAVLLASGLWLFEQAAPSGADYL